MDAILYKLQGLCHGLVSFCLILLSIAELLRWGCSLLVGAIAIAIATAIACIPGISTAKMTRIGQGIVQ